MRIGILTAILVGMFVIVEARVDLGARSAETLSWFKQQHAAFAGVSGEVDFYDICDQVVLLGYPCVHVNVTTADGFILDVIRLPSSHAKPYPVYLQHGLIDTGVTYVMNAHAHQNLACILHDQGYDVWLNNVRGNHYSMVNIRFNSSDPNYWYMIDMDEMAAMDLPAVIDAALATTSSATLAYVGHSQGGMMGFAAFSTSRPSYAKKVDLFVGLAPACFVSHTTSEIVKILGRLQPWEIELLIGNKTFLSTDYATRQVAKACPDLGTFCVHSLNAVFGYGNESNINASQLQFVTRYDPGGTSVNNLIHWAQMVQSGVFEMHDYGTQINEEFYHQPTPPHYNISAMEGPPVALFFGGVDALVSTADAEILVSQIPPHLIVHQQTIPSYNHMELVWGLDAHQLVYESVVQLVKKHRS